MPADGRQRYRAKSWAKGIVRDEDGLKSKCGRASILSWFASQSLARLFFRRPDAPGGNRALPLTWNSFIFRGARDGWAIIPFLWLNMKAGFISWFSGALQPSFYAMARCK